MGACEAQKQADGAVSADTVFNSAGWFKEAGGYGRGLLGADCVFNGWAPQDGTGTGHCCQPTYHNGDYNAMTTQNQGFELEAAEAYCSAQADFPKVCTVRQVKGIVEDGEASHQIS